MRPLITMDEEELRASLFAAQRNELTEHLLYMKLARVVGHEANRAVLENIARDELAHYGFWKGLTGRESSPRRLKLFVYYWICRILGLTFGIKLMEKGEEKAQEIYGRLAGRIPEIGRIVDDEDRHEHELLALIDEERLKYVGSIVLGLNDALVELTGALAGLTFAFRNTRLVAVAGLITGIAAAFSMASSEYLSAKVEAGGQPLRASFYTWTAYILTVAFLISPYLVFRSLYVSLGLTVTAAALVICIFTFYTSIARDLPFRKRFTEMLSISFGVAALSFGLGILVRRIFGIDS